MSQYRILNLGKFLKRIFNKRPTEGYVSEVDQLLADFDRNHEKTPSQIAEIKKHERVFRLRDYPEEEDLDSKIWAGF